MIIARPLLISLVLAGSAVGAFACSSSSSSPAIGGDAATGDDGGDAATVEASDDAGPDFGDASSTYPAFLPPAPKILKQSGSPIANVRVVPVFFQGDTDETRVLDMLGKYVASASFHAASTEYGVQSATVAPAIHVTDPAPALWSGLNAWIASSLDGSHVEWGATDPATLASSVYVVFTPSRWKFDAMLDGCYIGPSLIESVTVGGASDAGADAGPATRVAVGVVMKCTLEALSVADSVTAAISAVVLAAATDPPPSPAWRGIDAPHANWGNIIGANQITSLCGIPVPGYTVAPADVGYRIVRSWSNAAAAAGHDPCVPAFAPSLPYFNSVPDLPDMVPAEMGAGKVLGVELVHGKPKTIALRLFSDGATSGPWKISVLDRSALFNQPAMLGFKLDKDTGVNGEIVHLTINPLALTAGAAADFEIYSELNGHQSVWMGRAYRSK